MPASERWKRVEALYHAALPRPLAERATFLREACADDEGLRHEVESLLAQPASDAGFLVTPALAVAARAVGQSSGAMLATGHALGPYTILGLLGAGGMGEVYRARDSQLGRDVAIKMLPAVFVARSATGSRASSAKRGCWRRSTIRTSPRSTASRRPIDTGFARWCSSWSRVRRSPSASPAAPMPLDEALPIVATDRRRARGRARARASSIAI